MIYSFQPVVLNDQTNIESPVYDIYNNQTQTFSFRPGAYDPTTGTYYELADMVRNDFKGLPGLPYQFYVYGSNVGAIGQAALTLSPELGSISPYLLNIFTGVDAASCFETTGPTGTTSSVIYTCSVHGSVAGVYHPQFTYNGDSNYLPTPPISGDFTTVTQSAPAITVSGPSTTPLLGSTFTFTAVVTGPVGAVAPSPLGSWSITDGAVVNSCSGTTGPNKVLNVSTYTCNVLAAAAGTYTGTFIFTGDTSYLPVTSTVSATSPVVSTATPTIGLAATPTSPSLGGSETITASVYGATNALAPTGNLTWTITGSAGVGGCASTTGASISGTVTTYTCTFATPNVGDYVVVADYPGDGNYTLATSSSATLTIHKQTPGITVAASGSTGVSGATLLTTTVSGNGSPVAPTGAVSWRITDPTGATVPCGTPSASVTSGNTVTISCSFTNSISGDYYASSTVAEDANYVSATSSTIRISIGTTAPIVTVTATPTSPTTGQPITYTATVVGGDSLPVPGGSVLWVVSGQASSCSSTPAPVPSATYTTFTCIVDTPVAGRYKANATYTGDLNYSGAPTSDDVPVQVTAATPTMDVTVTPATPTLGNSITISATITGVVGAVRPAGTMTWTISGQKSACDSTSGPNNGSTSTKAIFTCVLHATTAGSYSYIATYSGDNNFTALPATDLVSIPIAIATPIASLDGQGDGVLGGNAIFTLTVTGPEGAMAPSGTITWSVSGTGGATGCTTTPTSTSVGEITTYLCNIAEANYGTYVVSATYPGDSNYHSALSNSKTIGVSNLTPSVTISVPTSPAPTLGGNTILTALVAGPVGTSSPATINYTCPIGTLDGINCDLTTGTPPTTTPATISSYTCSSGRLVGSNCLVDVLPAGTMSWSVTNAAGVLVTCSSVAPAIDTSGYTAPTTAYSCSLPTATAGGYSATAHFPGDANYSSANSAPTPIVVPQVSPIVSVTGAPLSNAFGAPIRFTATLYGASGSVAPNGGVTWHVSGHASTCSPASDRSVTGVNATYTCDVTVTDPGDYSAYVETVADSNYLSVTSSTATVGVGPQLPTMTIVSTPANPHLGDTITFTATINPTPGGPTPTGIITWSLSGSAGATVCDSTSGSGTAVQSCTVVARTAGIYKATAAYLGDTNYRAMSQDSSPVSVAKWLPTVSILNSGTPAAGGSVSFNALVAGVSTANAPTGTFTWSITGTGNISTCVPVNPPLLDIPHSLTFTCTEALPTVGTYVANGTYNGDSNYSANSATSADVVTITSTNPQYLPVTLGPITHLAIAPTSGAAVVSGTLTWDSLVSANTYAVQVGTSPTALLPVTCADNTAHSCNVINLISGNTYYFWVNGYQNNLAGTAIGQGIPATLSVTLPAYTPPPPPPPSPPPASGGGLPANTVPFPLAAPALTGVAGDKQVTLSWAALPDQNRTSYLVEFSVDGQKWNKVATLAASATTTLVTGLTNGVSTVLRLTPVGVAGAGVTSVVSVTPGAPAGAPTSLIAQSGDSQVDLSWTPPVDTGGLKINNYVVEMSTDGTNWTLASSTSGDTTQVNIQGLKNFTNYTFRVSAITNFGKGLSAVLATNTSALPSAPLALHIISTGSKSVTIGWALPSGASSSTLSGFQVEQSLDGITWTQVMTASSSSVSASLSGLVNGTTYEIRVTPVAGSGLGASSVILAAPGSAPDAVAKLIAAPGDKKITLSFTAPATNGGFSVDYYTVEMANNANGPWTRVIANSGSSLTKIDVPNLKNATTYFFRVSAVNQIGVGPVSNVVSSVPQPAAPAPVVKSFVLLKGAATITWTPSLGSNTKQILNFLIETSPDGLKWVVSKTLSSGANAYTISRTPNALLIRVRAVTAIGPGVPSLGVRIPGTAPTSTTALITTPTKSGTTPTKKG